MVLQHVRMSIGQTEIVHAVEAQLAVGVPLGLAVGLGAGLMAGTVRCAAIYALGGMAGGALAAVAYSLGIAIVLPETNTDALLPEEAKARLLWLAMLGGTIGIVIPLAGRRRG